MKSLRELLPPSHPDHISKPGPEEADPEFAKMVLEDAAAEDTRCCEYAPDTKDLPDYIRHLKGTHPEMADEIQEATNRLGVMIRQEWQTTFGGPLSVDFVCANPWKMAVLKATMEVSDLVPWVFGINADENLGPSRVRVTIEI